MYFYACGNIPSKHDSHKANTLWKLFHSFQCEIQELKSGPLTWCHVSLIGNHLTGPITSCYLGNTKFLLVVLHFHKIAISSWGESVTSQTHGFFYGFRVDIKLQSKLVKLTLLLSHILDSIIYWFVEMQLSHINL